MKTKVIEGYKIESYILRTYLGHRIGTRIKIITPEGKLYHFLDKITVKEALENAKKNEGDYY